MLSEKETNARLAKAKRGEASFSNWEMTCTLDRVLQLTLWMLSALMPTGVTIAIFESTGTSGEYLGGVRPGTGTWLLIVCGFVFSEIAMACVLTVYYRRRPYDSKFRQQTAEVRS